MTMSPSPPIRVMLVDDHMMVRHRVITGAVASVVPLYLPQLAKMELPRPADVAKGVPLYHECIQRAYPAMLT